MVTGTTTPLDFYEPDVFSAAQPVESKHYWKTAEDREKA